MGEEWARSHGNKTGGWVYLLFGRFGDIFNMIKSWSRSTVKTVNFNFRLCVDFQFLNCEVALESLELSLAG